MDGKNREVDHEATDKLAREFERELRAALERRHAPASLKRIVMERRNVRRPTLAFPTRRRQTRMVWLERLAASLVVAAVAGGAVFTHYADERRRGEEAKQQVFTALRITNRALDHVGAQLAEQDNKH
ncbi:MAG TPA: hypothetical protein VMT38_09850 [Terracidiphilus sp.]|nr:hypothetical protein [Terracidiphilus sp.]